MKGITFIGMSGAGKSTVGPELANTLGWQLYDTDKMMEEHEHKPIERVVADSSREEFLQLQCKVINGIDLHDTIVVTGGSVIYSIDCHAKLKSESWIVWLYASLDIIQERIGGSESRTGRILGVNESGLSQVFHEREPLYVALADYRVNIAHKTPQAIVSEILEHRKAVIHE